ncbi:MAG: aminomethyl transferase family protein [Clostridiales bacterium]|nr:aminomethyl transferase family protein [Clostridiales bacterium]
MNELVFDGNFKYNPFIPYDPTVNPLLTGYVSHPCYGGVQPFVYTDWRDEMLSWHDNCFIHAGLNPAYIVIFRGADCLKFFNKYFTNGFDNFPVGQIKHGVMVNEDGYIMQDGLLYRTGENEFYTFWLGSYIVYCAEKSGYDLEWQDVTGEMFMFQLSGPRALEIVEAATGEDFHGLPYLKHRESRIKGMNVRVLRLGMSGSLAYEVHGKFEDSIPVYNALLEAGKDYGIRRLGRHAYWNTHTEGGFPQWLIHFPYAWETDPAFMEWMEERHALTSAFAASKQLISGSMGPDLKPRFVHPFELGWGQAVNFGHDFVGKDALAAISGGPHRETVTLDWNIDDVMEIYRSEFEPGEPFAVMEGPEDYLQYGQHEFRADQVLVGDKFAGVSAGRIISWHYRKMLSLARIDPGCSKIGTEVFVLWGDPGTRQKKIRATVCRYPYNNECRNDCADLNQIPSGIKE